MIQPSTLAGCPSCGSSKIWKDGTQERNHSTAQRFFCKTCGLRFLDRAKRINATTQRSPLRKTKTQLKEMETLTSALHIREKPKRESAEFKGKLLEYAWWMKKEGYAESTITRRTKLLRTLANRGAQLLDTENVKVTISKQESWAPKTKALVVEAYSCFLKMHGGTWKPPKYKAVRKLPFIPSEHEIDQLIAGCNKKTAAFLQLLKETGMRSGEAWMLKWIDFDLEKRTVRVTPEKGGNPRLLRISDQLIAMVKGLHNDQALVFEGSHRHFTRTYRRQRKRISFKLKNERIKEIKFHTLRHWKATMEYHRTKDILHVMKLLGHRNIQNTLLYTQLVEFEGEEFHSAVAESVEEAQKLVEAGFEYVCNFTNVKLFRKRK